MLTECGAWLFSEDFFGYDLVSTDATSRQECRRDCQAQPGCSAVAFVGADEKCYLKQIPDGLEPISVEGTVSSLRLCAHEVKPGPDLVVLNSPGTDIADDICGEWLWDHIIPGEALHNSCMFVLDPRDPLCCVTRFVSLPLWLPLQT